MDLIGSVKLIENRLGGRKSGQSRSGQKNTRAVDEDGKKDSQDNHVTLAEQTTRLGGKVDIRA